MTYYNVTEKEFERLLVVATLYGLAHPYPMRGKK